MGRQSGNKSAVVFLGAGAHVPVGINKGRRGRTPEDLARRVYGNAITFLMVQMITVPLMANASHEATAPVHATANDLHKHRMKLALRRRSTWSEDQSGPRVLRACPAPFQVNTQDLTGFIN